MSDARETLESLWVYCTASNRLVPMPSEWSDLYKMLKNTSQLPSGGWRPAAPLILAAWHDSTPMSKQLRFKEHIEWAKSQDQLDEVGRFLRALPENKWCHFGEV